MIQIKIDLLKEILSEMEQIKFSDHGDQYNFTGIVKRKIEELENLISTGL